VGGTEAADKREGRLSTSGGFIMSNGVRDEGILDVIRLLAARRASGRVQVSTGMTDGALFFNKGQLVDAQVGRLTGFQAINALAAVPDATYNFDPSIEPLVYSSITAKERILLKDFFGIEAAEVDPAETVSPFEQSIPENDDEVTAVSHRPATTEPRPVHQPDLTAPFRPAPARSMLSPALIFIVLIMFSVAAAVAVVYRLRKPVPTASVAPTVQTPAPANSPQQPANAPATVADLSGNWSVVNTVEQTSYAAYKNMKVGFNVSINQTGKDFTGTGEKISENGRSLPATSRTPIVVKGTIDGDKVEATFSENGTLRTTNGRFVWRIDKTSGGLTGTFRSNAARSSGKSAATKGL
jgi:hypothetical protein